MMKSLKENLPDAVSGVVATPLRNVMVQMRLL